MYLEHFKLKEFPYLPSPDARFLFLADQVNETLQKCLYMISNRIGPVYTTAPIGAGKTTLAERLQQQLEKEGLTQDSSGGMEGDRKRYVVTYVVIPPKLTVNSLLRLVLSEFKVKTDRSYATSLEYFTEWLRTQHTAGIKPVLIIDEAQNLTPTHLKLLHFILNYETNREKLLQLVLFGQQQLVQKIDRFPEMKSRMYPASLSAFNRKDTEELISFRWYVAGGGTQTPFTRDSLEEIFKVSLGLPREIVKLCDLSLLRAFSQQRTAVLPEDVVAAAQELRLRSTKHDTAKQL
jgi:general secretion pathway protein A